MFTNERLGSISWEKVSDDDPAQHLPGSVWQLQGPGATGPQVTVDDCVATTAGECTGPDTNNEPGRFTVENLPLGEYVLTEMQAPAGFELDTTPRSGTLTEQNGDASLSFGAIVNIRQLGTVTWEKVSDNGALLQGSQWELRGPIVPGSTPPTVVIDDCVAADPTGCVNGDADHRAGMLRLEGLSWGAYELVETRAPAGYLLNPTVLTFSIGPTAPAQLTHDLGTVTNEPQTAPVIPLTGGIGTQHFIMTGVVLIALSTVLVVITRRRRSAR